MSSMPSYLEPSNLAKLQNWKDADQSHQSVVRFHSARHNQRAKNLDYVDGKHYTPDELDFYERTKRVPFVLNMFPTSRRSVVGTFLKEKFEMEFIPVNGDDQQLADALRGLAAFETSAGNDVMNDAVMAVHSWIGADSNILVWPEINPGERPYIGKRVLNPYAVNWDPNSIEFILRRDADFVDVDLWMSGTGLLQSWPKAKFKLDVKTGGGNDVTAVDNARDRDHEHMGFRNGRWHVVERYYRVTEFLPCTLDSNDEWVVISDVQKFNTLFPNQKIVRKKTETLYICQWCPEAQDEETFLYNGPYHSQPRDPRTRKILWPIVELIAEQYGSTARSFVTPLCDPNKMIDVMTTGIIEQGKHAGASYEQDSSAYLNPAEALRAKKLGAQPNQTFEMKPGMAGKGRVPTVSKEATADFTKGINIASQYINEQSSTPPAMKGISEGGTVAASLNMQRIEQGNLQLAEFITNFRTYRGAILNLQYAYWRQHYTDEMVFSIIGDNGKPKAITINQEVQGKDSLGNPIPNKIVKINDINSALFDVRLIDSYKSPTVRDRQLQVLGQMMQNQVIMQDPLLAGPIVKEFMRLADSSYELKQEIAKATSKSAADAAMASELDTIGSLQQIAGVEANAISPRGIPNGISRVPGKQPQPAVTEPSNQALESVQ